MIQKCTQDFGPLNIGHARVSWPEHFREISIQLPTLVVELLRDNEPPSFEDMGAVNQFQSSLAQRMKENETRIQLLQEQLNCLRVTQIQLQKQSFACDVVRSPLRRVPQDIISHILRHASSRDDYSEPDRHPPSLLSRVSSTVRDIVITTPKLWTTMRFSCTFWDTQENISPLILRLLYFSRRSTPLTFDLKLDGGSEQTSFEWEGTVPRVLQWISRLSANNAFLRRLGNLCISTSNVVRLYRKTQPNVFDNNHMPLISHIVYLDDDRFRPAAILERTMGNLPRLRHLWLGRHMDALDKTFNVRNNLNRKMDWTPWNKLETLYINQTVSVANWRIVMQRCTGLKALNIKVAKEDIDLWTYNVINHTSLTELVLCLNTYWGSLFHLFMDMSLPALQTLRVEYVRKDLGFSFDSEEPADLGEINPDHYLDVFSNVKHISVWNPHDSDHALLDMHSVLIASPSTVSLSVAACHGPIFHFLKFLQSESHQPLPNLKSLKLQYLTERAVDPTWPRLDKTMAKNIRRVVNNRRIPVPLDVPPGLGWNLVSDDGGLQSVTIRFIRPVDRYYGDTGTLELRRVLTLSRYMDILNRFKSSPMTGITVELVDGHSLEKDDGAYDGDFKLRYF